MAEIILTPEDFTFDEDKLEIVSGDELQIKLSIENATIFTDFDSDLGYTYNSSLAEFALSQLRQIDQTPANAVIAALFNTNINANWRKDAGVLTGTANGSPTISGGKVVCASGANGVYVNITNDHVSTIKAKWTPPYSGAPSTNRNIFGIQEASGTANRILLTHSPSGDNFRITLSNSVGTAIYTAVTIGASGVNVTAGVEEILELSIDNVTGVIRLFRNDNLHGTLTPGPWSFTANAARLYIGAMPTIYNSANASFRDLVFFSTVQHTSGPISSAYTLPATIYAASTINAPTYTYDGLGSVLAIVSFAVTVSNEPRFTISIDGADHVYWDGSSFSESNETYAQASTASEFITNLPSLNVDGGTIADLNIYFNDSNDQMSLDDLTLIYSVNGGYFQDAPFATTVNNLNADCIRSIFNDNALKTIINEDSLDSIGISIIADGIEKYYDVSEWVANSNDSDNTNSLDELTDEVLQALGVTNTFKLRIYFISGDGSSSPSLTQITVDFCFNPPDIGDNIKTIDIYSYERYSDKTVQVGAKVYAYPLDEAYYIDENTNIAVDKTPVLEADAIVDPNDGSWSRPLIASNRLKRFKDNTSNVPYVFERISPAGKISYVVAYVAGIEGESVKLETLTKVTQ